MLMEETTFVEVEGARYPIFIRKKGLSSMDVAWELIKKDALPPWGSVLLKSQSAGRGRMGRVWQSPPGHIYAALRLPVEGFFKAEGASLALAYCLIEALSNLNPVRDQVIKFSAESMVNNKYSKVTLPSWAQKFHLKWPNDIIYSGDEVISSFPDRGASESKILRRRLAPSRQGGKVGGILLESKAAGLVAGIGLNLISPPEGDWLYEREEGAPPPAALPFLGAVADVWLYLVKQAIVLYNNKFKYWSINEIVSEAEKILFWRGQKVRVIAPATEPPTPSSALIAWIDGLAPDGSLKLSNEDGNFKLWSGSLCLSPEMA